MEKEFTPGSGSGICPLETTGYIFSTSADGSTVVGNSSSSSGWEPFVWDETNGMRALRQMLIDQGIDMTGWDLTEANGISGDGLTIVGYGTNPSGYTEAWIATIPEPSTALLLGLGLLGIGLQRRGPLTDPSPLSRARVSLFNLSRTWPRV